MEYLVTLSNDSTAMGKITHCYEEKPEKGFLGYLEIEFEVWKEGKQITLPKEELEDIESQLLKSLKEDKDI